MTLFLGFLDELRDYYEFHATMVLLAFHTAATLFGVPIESRERPPAGAERSATLEDAAVPLAVP